MQPAAPIDLVAEAAERRARHLAYAQQMQETASRLLALASQRAAEQLAQPKPDPDTPPAETRQPRQPDYVLAVARFGRLLNQAMTLEDRVANGAADRARRSFRAPAAIRRPGPPDPRRALLQHPLHQAVKLEKAPHQAARLREIDERIAHELEADPEQSIKPIDILVAIADDLGIHIEPKRLSDEILGMPPRKPPVEYIPDNTQPVLPLDRSNL